MLNNKKKSQIWSSKISLSTVCRNSALLCSHETKRHKGNLFNKNEWTHQNRKQKALSHWLNHYKQPHLAEWWSFQELLDHAAVTTIPKHVCYISLKQKIFHICTIWSPKKRQHIISIWLKWDKQLTEETQNNLETCSFFTNDTDGKCVNSSLSFRSVSRSCHKRNCRCTLAWKHHSRVLKMQTTCICVAMYCIYIHTLWETLFPIIKTSTPTVKYGGHCLRYGHTLVGKNYLLCFSHYGRHCSR